MTTATVSGRAWLGLVTLACMWGSSFLFIRLGLEGFSPPQVVLGRLTVGALVLGTIVWLAGTALPRRPTVWAHLALMGLVGNVAPWLLLAWGQQFIASGLAGVLNAATPLFTTLFASLALADERLPASRAFGVGLGFVGVVLVINPFDAGQASPLTASIPGQLACVGAAACYGVGFVYTRRFLANHGHSPLALAAGQLACGAATLWILVPLVWRAPLEPGGAAIASVAALGVIGTGLAYLLYYRLLSELGATRTSTTIYLIPLVAVTLGVVVLGEPVTASMLAGAVVVVIGVAMAQRPARAVPATPPPIGGAGGGPPVPR